MRFYGYLHFYRLNDEIQYIRIALYRCVWLHFYTDLRLNLMGFDFDGMSDIERTRNIVPELQAEATKLYWSHMGIGWPLKTIIGIIVMSLYPSLSYGVISIVNVFISRVYHKST